VKPCRHGLKYNRRADICAMKDGSAGGVGCKEEDRKSQKKDNFVRVGKVHIEHAKRGLYVQAK
jgi:hypothetical protein